MQEIISGLVTCLVDEDPYLQNLVEKLKDEKKNKQLRKVTSVESTDIFDQISSQSPWIKKESSDLHLDHIYFCD